MKSPFSVHVTPDWQGLRDCILRKGQPNRVYHIELFLDAEVQDAICERYDVCKGLKESDRHYPLRRQIALQRFLGYDYVRCSVDNFVMPLHNIWADDTAALQRRGGRSYVDEHRGPITNWYEFEAYPWPDVETLPARSLDWYEENLPDDMCVMGSGGFAHFAEYIVWLMGYETFCMALYEQRDLVLAIRDKLTGIFVTMLNRMIEYQRVGIIWGSDDMGFRTGLLFAPDDMRELVLAGHKIMAQMSHDAGRPYLLHSCGKLDDIMEDLIQDVKIDAKHSFEDTIQSVKDAKKAYGDRIGLLGGIDLDFLCRADPPAVRKRVRETLDTCMPGGGYCLGTGNSVANYVPVENYLAMLDEGRRYSA